MLGTIFLRDGRRNEIISMEVIKSKKKEIFYNFNG